MVDLTWFYNAKPLTFTTVSSNYVIFTTMREQNIVIYNIYLAG